MEPRSEEHENAPAAPNISNGIYGSNEVRNSFGPMIEAVRAELEREKLEQNGANAQNGQVTLNPNPEIDVSSFFQSANNTMGEDDRSIEDSIIDVPQNQSLVNSIDDSLEIQGNRNKINDEQPYFGPRSKDFTGTTVPVWFMMVFNVLVIILVFALPIACNRKGMTPAEACLLEPFSWLLYFHTLYWLIHLIGDQWLKVRIL